MAVNQSKNWPDVSPDDMKDHETTMAQQVSEYYLCRKSSNNLLTAWQCPKCLATNSSVKE